jgi:threonine/homoserine/homoserine lactone efflux protein
LIAALGLTVISELLIAQRDILSLVGGLFLLYLGIKTLMSRPADEAAKPTRTANGLLGAYGSTLALTLTNPMTILSFTAIFAGAGAISTESGSALMMVIGVFLGSAAWWLLLSGGVSLLRNRFDHRLTLWVNRLSGVVIVVFALLVLLT